MTTEDTTIENKMTSVNDEDEELINIKPVETAHTTSRRRRGTFGSVNKPTTTTAAMEEEEEPIVAAISGDEDPLPFEDVLEENPIHTKRAWELEEDELDTNNSNDDLLTPDSQDTVVNDNDNDNTNNNNDIVNATDSIEDADSLQEEDEKDVEKDEDDASLADPKKNPKEAINGNDDKPMKDVASDKQKDNKEDEDDESEKERPDIEDLIFSTDNLFVACKGDLEKVTAKMIYNNLEAEYSVKLTKEEKKAVKQHLTDLVNGELAPSVGENKESNDNDADDNKSHDSSSEDESSDEEEEAEAEEPSSEYEDEEEDVPKRRRPAPKKKKTSAKSGSSKPKKEKAPTGRRKSTRKSAKSKKTAELHKQAEKLRKKRMQELRVRNEELQLEQSKEDQKRAELIAAKFETNSDELRWQRIEDRMDLLQKLDKKRVEIIEVEDMPTVKEEKTSPRVPSKEEDDESDSDDDLELEIEGVEDSTKRLFPSVVKSTALSVLDMADKASPLAKKGPNEKKRFLACLRGSGATKPVQLSPSRNVHARAMLRNKLQQKQRKMGNMWLARELGYKNEKDHLRDCVEAEKKKRDIVLQRETERLAANERTQMRARLREQAMEGEGEEEEAEAELEVDNPVTNSNDNDEEDEEMMLAKQVEKEQADEVEEDESPGDTHESSQGTEGSSPEAPKDNEEASDANVDKSNNDDAYTQDEPFPDAQPDEYPTVDEYFGADDKSLSGTKELGSVEKAMETQQTEDGSQPVPEAPVKESGNTDEAAATQQSEKEGNPPSEAVFSPTTEGDESDGEMESQQLETQQFETQAPYPALKATSIKENETQPEKAVEKKEGDEMEMAPKAKAAADDDIVDTDDEVELEEEEGKGAAVQEVKKDRNAGWKAMLQKEAKALKKQKKKGAGNEFLETEADEEEEEEIQGLHDFGFSVQKKKGHDDEEDGDDDEINADDLKHVVDDLSDDEGDEEVGDKKRRAMLAKEEKERHKEMLRRMREGYDGRRGGIAGGGVGARGNLRFDQLVAADNRESAKQLGLLNDDELDSDDEGNGEKNDAAEEEDEAALIDKMLKDRFLHRSSVDMEENFSEDEDEDENKEETNEDNDEDEKQQEMLAKRFAKRARMQRLIDEYGDDEEFTNSRLIEEDSNMKEELSQMKNGLARKRSASSVSRASSISTDNGGNSNGPPPKRPKGSAFGGGFLASKGSLSLALQSSRQNTKRGRRTSFLGAAGGSQESGKSISFGDSQLSSSYGGASNSQMSFSLPTSKLVGGRKGKASLLSQVVAASSQKRR